MVFEKFGDGSTMLWVDYAAVVPSPGRRLAARWAERVFLSRRGRYTSASFMSNFSSTWPKDDGRQHGFALSQRFHHLLITEQFIAGGAKYPGTHRTQRHSLILRMLLEKCPVFNSPQPREAENT